MSTEQLSLLISVVALLGAFGSLFWQIYDKLIIARARLKIRTEGVTMVPAVGDQVETIRVTVVNLDMVMQRLREAGERVVHGRALATTDEAWSRVLRLQL